MGRCASTSTSQPRITVSAATAYGFFPQSAEKTDDWKLQTEDSLVFRLKSRVLSLRNSLQEYIIGDSRIYQIVSDSFIRF
jgi:hypothetical protein